MAGVPPSSTSREQSRVRPVASTWLPATLLGAGLALGLVLWSRWGLAVALEAIRTYCF